MTLYVIPISGIQTSLMIFGLKAIIANAILVLVYQLMLGK
jgi:hypothetical protein